MSVADDTCEWAVSDDETTATPACGYDQKGRKFYIIGGKVLCPCPGCGLTVELVKASQSTSSEKP